MEKNDISVYSNYTWAAASSQPILANFGDSGVLTNIIKHAKFHIDR
jgi:hypothetical protein